MADNVIEINYMETFAINLLFEDFNEDNGTSRPGVLEYKYINSKKRVSFKEEKNGGYFSKGMMTPIMIGMGIILITFLIILTIRRKKKSFMG